MILKMIIHLLCYIVQQFFFIKKNAIISSLKRNIKFFLKFYK